MQVLNKKVSNLKLRSQTLATSNSNPASLNNSRTSNKTRVKTNNRTNPNNNHNNRTSNRTKIRNTRREIETRTRKVALNDKIEIQYFNFPNLFELFN